MRQTTVEVTVEERTGSVSVFSAGLDCDLRGGLPAIQDLSRWNGKDGLEKRTAGIFVSGILWKWSVRESMD